MGADQLEGVMMDAPSLQGLHMWPIMSAPGDQVSFPYTGFYYDGSSAYGPPASRRVRIGPGNFGYSIDGLSVRVYGGVFYCGTTPVTVSTGLVLSGAGDAFLNVKAYANGQFRGMVQGAPAHDLSIRLYSVAPATDGSDDLVLYDYRSGTMFVPYYN